MLIAAIPAGRARSSITARMDRAIQKAIAGIDEQAWVRIKHKKAIHDKEEDAQPQIAQIAQIRVCLHGPQTPGDRPGCS